MADAVTLDVLESLAQSIAPVELSLHSCGCFEKYWKWGALRCNECQNLSRQLMVRRGALLSHLLIMPASDLATLLLERKSTSLARQARVMDLMAIRGETPEKIEARKIAKDARREAEKLEAAARKTLRVIFGAVGCTGLTELTPLSRKLLLAAMLDEDLQSVLQAADCESMTAFYNAICDAELAAIAFNKRLLIYAIVSSADCLTHCKSLALTVSNCEKCKLNIPLGKKTTPRIAKLCKACELRFGLLYEINYDWMRCECHRWQRFDFEDMAQEDWLWIFEHGIRNYYEGGGAFRGLASGVIRNSYRANRRHRRAKEAFENEWLDVQNKKIPKPVQEKKRPKCDASIFTDASASKQLRKNPDDPRFASETDEASELVSHKETCELLRSHIAVMPSDLAEAFWIHHVENLTFAAASQKYGIPASTLASRVKRVMDALAAIYQDEKAFGAGGRIQGKLADLGTVIEKVRKDRKRQERRDKGQAFRCDAGHTRPTKSSAMGKSSRKVPASEGESL